MEPAARTTIGNRLAPPRFILFVLLLLLAGGTAVWHFDDWRPGFMYGFDVAAVIFLLSCLPLLRIREARSMREHAAQNDANRSMLLVITGIVTLAILAAVAAEVEGGAQAGGTKILVVATLLIAWLFGNSIYGLHYAHLAYAPAARGPDRGIEFPGTPEPVYADFAYFAFTLGMTFQTSDVAISNAAIRRVVTLQCLAAFVFNIGVLAFTINVLGG